MVAMRLTRIGSKKCPSYRIVVIEKRWAQNGRFLEILGQYNPLSEPSRIEVNEDRARYWLPLLLLRFSTYGHRRE